MKIQGHFEVLPLKSSVAYYNRLLKLSTYLKARFKGFITTLSHLTCMLREMYRDAIYDS